MSEKIQNYETGEITHTNNELAITSDEKEVLKSTVASGLSDNEFGLFLGFCKRKGLDPFLKEVHAIKRQGVLSFQMGIDGLRHLGERTGKYAGQQIEFYDKKSDQWRQVWTREEPPTAAKCTLYRKDFAAPIVAIAHWREYAKEGKEGFMWRKMPTTMIGKCAEAIAWRKAFPREMSGVYETSEISANETPGNAKQNVLEVIDNEAKEPENEFKATKDVFNDDELDGLRSVFENIKSNYDGGDELYPRLVAESDTLEIDGEIISQTLLKDMKNKMKKLSLNEAQERDFVRGLTGRAKIESVESLYYNEAAALAVLFYNKILTRKAITSIIAVGAKDE